MKYTNSLTKLIYDNGKVYYRIDWQITRTYLFGLIKSVEEVQDKLLFDTEHEASLYALKAIKPSKEYSDLCYTYLTLYLKLDNDKKLSKSVEVSPINSIDDYYTIRNKDLSIKNIINSNQFKEEKV